MTRLCEYVGHKRDEITKDVLYLLSSSEKGIIQSNCYSIPKLIKMIILLSYSTSWNLPSEIIKKVNTDNVFSDDTLFLTEIAVLKVKIYI